MAQFNKQLGKSLFGLLFFFGILGSQVFAVETYKDEFNTVSYSNNDGTASFTGAWFDIICSILRLVC